MTKTWKHCRFALAATAPVLMTGCGLTTFDMTIVNDASTSINVQVVERRFLNTDRIVHNATLTPGESRRLDSFSVEPLNPVKVQARLTNDDFGLPDEHRVEPGSSFVRVYDTYFSVTGSIDIAVQRRPQDNPIEAENITPTQLPQERPPAR